MRNMSVQSSNALLEVIFSIAIKNNRNDIVSTLEPPEEARNCRVQRK